MNNNSNKSTKIADITGSNNRIGIGARIGNNPTGSFKLFPGKIDDVRIYSRSLSEEEISALYLREKP